MKTLELSDEEEAVLAVELVQLISQAEYPLSDRVRTLGAILNKLRPEPAPPAPPASAEAIRAAVERPIQRRSWVVQHMIIS